MATKQTKETVKALEAKNAIPETEKKPLNKFGKQEKVTVAGIEYTMQFPGVRRAQQILDSSKGPAGIFFDEAYNTKLMEEVIVEPKIDWDYWDEHEGYRELMDEADTFLGGLFK